MPLDVFSAVEQYHPQEIENLAVFDEKFVCGGLYIPLHDFLCIGNPG